jgi:hypothetical protein
MISKISSRDSTTVIWICHGSNTYDHQSLPLMCDGRVELKPHWAPLDLDDIRRLSQKKVNPDKGYRFERQDTEMLRRVAQQFDYLDDLPAADFKRLMKCSTITTLQSLPEVLASLDIDPEQTSKIAIKLTGGKTLPETVDTRHRGFAIILKGQTFAVRILLNNRFIWASYDHGTLDRQYNPMWLFEKPDLGDPSVRPVRKAAVRKRKPAPDTPTGN